MFRKSAYRFSHFIGEVQSEVSQFLVEFQVGIPGPLESLTIDVAVKKVLDAITRRSTKG